MARKPSSGERDREIAALLTAETGPDPLKAVTELSRLLTPGSAGAIDALVRQAEAAGERDAADAVLLRTERAAQLAAAGSLRAWARLRRGVLAAGRQNEALALELVPPALEELDTQGVPPDASLLPAYFEGADWLWEQLVRVQRLAEARELLVRMLRHASARAAHDVEARVVLKLLWISLMAGDLRAAETHALALVDGLWAPLLRAEDTRDTTLDLLRSAASSLYEEGDPKYGSFRRIGRSLAAEGGADGDLVLALARSAFSEEDFADSLNWFDRLLEAPEQLLPGYDVSALHHRRAICLARLDRPAEALQAIERAVAIAPEDPYRRFAVGEVLESLGSHAGAIREYSAAATLAEARMAAGPPDAGRRPARSKKEYESSTPVEDLRDFALMRLGSALRESGDQPGATAAMERLLAAGDEISQASALLTLADWAKEDNRPADAAALLERALPLGSGRDEEVAFRLAPLLIELGNYQRAIEAVAPFCHKSRSPEKCVELLDRIPRTWQGYRQVLKQRGYAKTEAGWARDGFAELTEAAAADPSDAGALVMRALARLTLGIKDGQKEWNASRSMRHIRESLDDLYAARRLDPEDRETLRIIQWLVERSAANPEMLEIFSAGGSPGGDLFAAFPHLEAALDTSWRANELARTHRFAEAAQVWLEAQAAHDAAGFKILAGRLSLRLADVYIRLLDLDAVAEHLARAEQLRFLVNVPLSLDVLARYEKMVAERGPFEKPAMGREVEYAWIYDHTLYDFARLQFITASYRHRVGDVEGALECVKGVEPLLERLPEYIGAFFGVEEVLWVIAIQRDAQRYDDALRLLDALQSLPEAAARSFDLLYMRGLIHDVQGDSLRAVGAYERALAVPGTRTAGIGMLPYVQYAASLLNAGRPADALEVLRRVDAERDAITERDRLAYYAAAAWVFEANGRLSDAVTAVERAIPIVEATRADIQDTRGRRSWQGQQHNLFSIAVRVYLASGNPRRAWEVIQLSRARTLLDELSFREAASFEEGALVSELDAVEEAARIALRGIAAAAPAGVSGALHAETMARLSAVLSPSFHDIVASEAFSKGDLNAVREMLVERRAQAESQERAARERAGRPGGALLDFAGIAGLLKEEGQPWQ